MEVFMSETCYILGAGFSVIANLPMQQNIIDKMSSKSLRIVKKLFSDQNKNNLKNIPLEDIFTFIDRAMINNEVISGMDYGKFYETKNGLLENIIKIFNKSLGTANKIMEYEYFFNKIVEYRINKNASISIVSLNWDTIPEYYINQAYRKYTKIKGGIDYSCFDWDYDENEKFVPSIWRKTKGFNTIKCLKIHGSINWVLNRENGGLYIREQNSKTPKGIILEKENRNTYEYLMITPTLLKNLNNTHLKMVWHNTGLDLAEAKRIIFLGYSFPLADFDFRYILMKSLMQNKKIKIRVLLFPKKPINEEKYIRNETEKRYKSFFVGHDIDFKYMDIREFLVNEKLIMGW
jgi:hypothetical protein